MHQLQHTSCLSANTHPFAPLHQSPPSHRRVPEAYNPARQLVDWARQKFYQEASKPDERLTLAKACMLIALEEEAAAAVGEDHLDIRQTLSLSSADPILFARPTPSRSIPASYIWRETCPWSILVDPSGLA